MSDIFDAMPTWRPKIPNSIDGEPLAVNISDLFFSFPYERLPSNGFISALMRPDVTIALSVAYLASKPALKAAAKKLGITGKSSAFVYAVAAHNLGLALFSAIVLVNSWPIVLAHIHRRGWKATYCNQDGSLWAEGLGGWATIFYISKYYEFVDTWVLIMKGKDPSFLQTYHHVGIVITMWGAVVCQSAWILVVVLLNSGIHTLMYTYFFIKTLYPRKEIPAAKYLTSAQMLQFIIGILYNIPVHLMGDMCVSLASRFVAASIQLYGLGLLFLFQSFAAKKYEKKMK